MGLREVERIPSGAVHVPDQDQQLPIGTTIKQFRLDTSSGTKVYEQFTMPDGHVRRYELTPDRQTRCGERHPSHTNQVRCEEAAGHSGNHFNSFFMRSWESI